MILCMLLMNVIPCFASSTGTNCPQNTVIAYLSNDNGNIIELNGELIAQPQLLSAENNEYSATYMVAVPRARRETTSIESDPSLASTVYLTVRYNVSGNQYLLTGVAGYWEIEDVNVSVTSSKVDYSCHANEHVFGRTVRNNFSFSTNFSQYTPDNGGYSTVGATLHLKYRMDSDTWNFDLSNNVLG